MKKLLITGVAALLTSAAMPAKAEMFIPPQYHGTWCAAENTSDHAVYRRCKADVLAVFIEVTSQYITVDNELCGIGIGWQTKNGHAFTVGCPKHKFSQQMELQFDARRRLHVREAGRKMFDQRPAEESKECQLDIKPLRPGIPICE
jgi:hypothetical protein